ncbi:MAG: hypothetical protein QNJ97_00275 [Myxococcota bacterium]|nr:hypothetical protein [Myxococcota bacterium]
MTDPSRTGKYMQSDLRRLGVCFTCIDKDACTHRKNWQGPVMFCEEFRVYQPPSSKSKKIVGNMGTEAAGFAAKAKEKPEYRGLCANCLQAATCTFQRPRGGVWYCEEYT